jgi:hypothetical protein
MNSARRMCIAIVVSQPLLLSASQWKFIDNLSCQPTCQPAEEESLQAMGV